MKCINLEPFLSGTEERAYRFMGCHQIDEARYCFRVWAPHAQRVYLSGSFCAWNVTGIPMYSIGGGIYEVVTALPMKGDSYKYVIFTEDSRVIWKADPYAVIQGKLPNDASIVADLKPYDWSDGAYRMKRKNVQTAPMNIYELQLGSWRRKNDGSFYSCKELAEMLVPYLLTMGYTHVELLPFSEYPFEPSWGYQVTGYYALSNRFGLPEDLKYLVNLCHLNNIGVIADWVPGHFPKDSCGLYEYDGSCCYELSDPEINEHPQWGTRLFDYSRPEVVSFLISNAVYWIDEFHFDGIRVDAVATMLYLDFERPNWKPNEFGTNINYPAIRFLQKMNTAVRRHNRYAFTVAEESTTFPDVTKPVSEGGLGFSFKWNMGWMNDTLSYFSQDPLFRKYHHNKLTFTMTYAFSEHFILPLSHDEVVHGKHSLIERMPGQYTDKFANLRLLSAYQIMLPGKKLSFMGSEFGQFIEWNEQQELDWFLLDYPAHEKHLKWTKDLNSFYLQHPELWKSETDWSCFKWLTCDDADLSVIAFLRKIKGKRPLIAVFNFCPVERIGYPIGLPYAGTYEPVLNSDDPLYGGNGTELVPVVSETSDENGFPNRAGFTLPPLSVVVYRLINH